ncbi:MAG: hypothetical protein M9922_07205 [Microthrixaceae bacterium]|nr:hypothetical protein [Microthrixaceae bacterium]
MFRVLHNRCWIGGPERSTIAVEGSAVFVWLVLEIESTAAEVATEIRHSWPELGEVRTSDVQHALDVLVMHDLVERTGLPADESDPA